MKIKLLYVAALIITTALYSCGSDEESSEESSGRTTDEVETDSTDADSTDNSNLLVSDEEVDIDTIEVDAKAVSSIEKAAVGEEGKSEAASAVFKTFDLSEFGYNLTISLPEKTKMEVNDFDEVVLTFGNDFIMEVGENYDGTPSEVKSKFKGNLHNQLMGYVVEDGNGFVRKIKSNGVISHNLFYVVNDGNMDIAVKSPMGQAYSQDEILVMWKACQTIKVK